MGHGPQLYSEAQAPRTGRAHQTDVLGCRNHVWVSGSGGCTELPSLELLKGHASADVTGQSCSRPPPPPQVKGPQSFEAVLSGTTPTPCLGGCGLALKDTQASHIPLPGHVTVWEKLSQKAWPPDTWAGEGACEDGAHITARMLTQPRCCSLQLGDRERLPQLSEPQFSSGDMGCHAGSGSPCAAPSSRAGNARDHYAQGSHPGHLWTL